MSKSKIDPNAILGLANIFSNANAGGTLSNASKNIITGNLGAVVVAGAAGKDTEDILTSDVTLVTLLVDASSSIHSRNLEDAVRSGQNGLVDALANSPVRESVLMALWTFNEDIRVVHSYVGTDDAARLDRKTYNAAGSTRLYDTWCDALAANVAYAQKLRDGGTPCRSIVVVITDGEDCGSKRRAGDCATLSRDLLASEQFILAFVGVGTDVDFHAVAKSMGVPDGCILKTDATPQAMRKVFGMVKQSTIRASQGIIQPGPNIGFFSP